MSHRLQAVSMPPSACLPCCKGHAVLQVAVQKPFEAQLPEGRERLMQLLSHLAIRASKNDLEIMVRRTHKVSPV